jgi:hypothetical protein
MLAPAVINDLMLNVGPARCCCLATELLAWLVLNANCVRHHRLDEHFLEMLRHILLCTGGTWVMRQGMRAG